MTAMAADGGYEWARPFGRTPWRDIDLMVETPSRAWFGGEFPTSRGRPQQTAGWSCPGCERCFAPDIKQCRFCGPKSLRDRIPAEEPVRLGGSHRTCPAPLEGGMCGCEDGDTP